MLEDICYDQYCQGNFTLIMEMSGNSALLFLKLLVRKKNSKGEPITYFKSLLSTISKYKTNSLLQSDHLFHFIEVAIDQNFLVHVKSGLLIIYLVIVC